MRWGKYGNREREGVKAGTHPLGQAGLPDKAFPNRMKVVSVFNVAG